MGEIEFQKKNLSFIFENKFDTSILQKWETIKSKYRNNTDIGYDIFLSMLDPNYTDQIWSEVPSKSLSEFKSFLQNHESDPETLKGFYDYISVEGNLWIDIQASKEIRTYLKEIFRKVSQFGRSKQNQNFQLFTYFIFGNRFYRPIAFDQEIEDAFSNDDFSNHILGKILKQNFHQLHENWKKKNFIELESLGRIFNVQLDVNSKDELYFEKLYSRYAAFNFMALSNLKPIAYLNEKEFFLQFNNTTKEYNVSLGQLIFHENIDYFDLRLKFLDISNDVKELSFVFFEKHEIHLKITRENEENTIAKIHISVNDQLQIPVKIEYQSNYIHIPKNLAKLLISSDQIFRENSFSIPIEYKFKPKDLFVRRITDAQKHLPVNALSKFDYSVGAKSIDFTVAFDYSFRDEIKQVMELVFEVEIRIEKIIFNRIFEIQLPNVKLIYENNRKQYEALEARKQRKFLRQSAIFCLIPTVFFFFLPNYFWSYIFFPVTIGGTYILARILNEKNLDLVPNVFLSLFYLWISASLFFTLGETRYSNVLVTWLGIISTVGFIVRSLRSEP